MARATRPVGGQVVLVTGAARGIGAESARQLAARGAKLALVGLEPDELAGVAADCGPEAVALEADVTDPTGLTSAVEGAVARFGGIDHVIANAGIAPAGPIRHIDPAAFERTIAVNLLGVWRTVRACLPYVIERRGYALVVASAAAAVHGPGLGAYSASKAGAEAFADSLRVEVAHLGVDVGVGYFSWIGTEMVAGADAHPALGFARAKLPGPFAKTYPVSAAGEAIADGIERRRRWVTVPNSLRALLLLRGALGPVFDSGGRRDAAEMDERFARDVAERGTEASAPVGAGGRAAGARGPSAGSLNRT
jgi:NAD(P)-dependent dehydrogenase (short-subunit alcohol dehydrogenase family)